MRFTNDRQGDKIARLLAIGNRPEKRRALGTIGQTIRRVLDVAAVIDLSVMRGKRCANPELRVGHVSFKPRFPRFLDQAFRQIHATSVALIRCQISGGSLRGVSSMMIPFRAMSIASAAAASLRA